MSKKYGIDLRSASDPQIAEKVIVNILGKRVTPFKPPRGYYVTYTPPEYIKFKTKQLQEVFNIVKDTKYLLTAAGSPTIPKAISELNIKIGNTSYKMGVGGLHSKEKKLVVTDGLTNADIASMYPSIIMNLGLFPETLGHVFKDIYGRFMSERLEAKRKGDKEVSDMLKIVLNGLYGKFGNKYSTVYDPSLLLHTTLTGQLTLLMCIEALELKNISVVSANTDGVECHTPKRRLVKKAKRIIAKQGEIANLTWEFGNYKALYARDVNNYIAIYDNYVKAIGVYGNRNSLMKNKTTPIVYKAIREFLLNNTPIKQTIDSCKDFVDFTSAVTVMGGAVTSTHVPEFEPEGWGESLSRNNGRVTKKMQDSVLKLEKEYIKKHGTFLGKVVRFYYSTQGSTIYYKTSGNKVPKSDGAKQCTVLKDTIPEDLDYNTYYKLADEYLKDLGYAD